MRAKIGTLTMATANMIWGRPRSSQATMPIASRMPGIASMTSTTRIRTESTLPPMPPASGADRPADEDAHDDRGDAGHEAHLGAVEDAAVLVATLRVRAHDVLAGRRLEAVGERALERAVRARGTARTPRR